MNRRFAEVLYNARRCSEMNTETAAMYLGISSRTLQHYESGSRTAPDRTVAGMVTVYNNPALGYYYLSRELETGRLLLPPAIPSGVASKSIRMRMALEHARDLQHELDSICMDDVVDDTEKKTLSGTISKYVELAAACINIMLMAGFTQNKKDALAATRTSSRKM